MRLPRELADRKRGREQSPKDLLPLGKRRGFNYNFQEVPTEAGKKPRECSATEAREMFSRTEYRKEEKEERVNSMNS